jgi:hypothetical protein
MPMLVDERASIADIDEALHHMRAIPTDQRGPAWQAYCDKLLELRGNHHDHTPQFTGATHQRANNAGHTNKGAHQ